MTVPITLEAALQAAENLYTIGDAAYYIGLSPAGVPILVKADQVHYLSQNWYAPSVDGVVGLGSVLTPNTIRMVPFFVREAMTISDLGARVGTAAAGALFQLAFYDMDPATHLPTGLPLAATGDISGAAAAAISGDIIGANPLIQPGHKFAAVNGNAAAAALALSAPTSGQSRNSALFGSKTLANVMPGPASSFFAYSLPSDYGIWPDMTGKAITEAVGAIGTAYVAFKVA